MTDERKRIAVALSGGVDSSFAAALLVEQGHDVFAVMMRLWSASPDDANLCCSPQDVAIAENVASTLGIPFHVLDAKERFKAHVVDAFIDDYSRGVTPNPCLSCNRTVRWGFLLQEAVNMGATHLATGHYARIEKRKHGYVLLRAKDLSKDQSYVLSVLGQPELARTILPLGGLMKEEVRRQARLRKLPVADKPDSQDLCFVPNGDYRDFLRQQNAALPPPGPIIDVQGTQLGVHDGLSNYTIGQRRGIGVAAQHAYYVIEKRIATNTLVVGPRHALGRSAFTAGPINWIAGQPPDPNTPLCVRVRYKAPEVPGCVHVRDDMVVDVQLDEPIPDITPGQAAVFYSDDICLGGGTIRA